MLKKLGALLLALLLIATLAACGGNGNAPASLTPEEQAFEAYTNIMQRLSLDTEQPGAYDIDFIMDIEMSLLDETVLMATSGNIKMIVDGEDMQASMVMEMDMGFEQIVMELYMALEDGVLFAQVMVDGEEWPPEFFPIEDMFDDVINTPDVEFDAFDSVEMEEVDGNTVFHIVLSGEELADFVMESMEEELAQFDGLEMDIVIDDVLMTLVVDANGNPLSMTMDMFMHMGFEFEGEFEEMGMRMTSTFIFNDFGDSVQVSMLV